MGWDRHGRRFCDECGRQMAKAHRIEGSNEYCGSCYKRVFVSRTCVQCNGIARAHHLAPTELVVCAPCTRRARVCQRCERPLPRASKAVPGGHLCAACAPYSKNPVRCDGCHRSVLRVSSLPQLGIIAKLCDVCRNRHTHRTCSHCGRYRVQHSIDALGKPRCAACVEGRERQHACPTCETELAGDGAGQCRACQLQQRLKREATLLPAALEHTWAQALYVSFADWLLRKQPTAPRLPATYARQFIFFDRLDVVIATEDEITAANLLRHFEVEQLRKHFLAVQFLQEHLGFVIEASAKAEAAERSRVRESLYAVRREPWSSTLNAYAKWHADKGTATRTQRQYIAAAKHLLRQRKEGKYTQAELDRTLHDHPGSRANLAAFVRFGHEHLGWDMAMPTLTSKRTHDPRSASGRLAHWLDQIEAQGLEKIDAAVLGRILQTAFALPPIMLADLKVELLGRRLRASVDDVVIDVPKPLRAIAQEWDRRQAEAHKRLPDAK